MLISHNYQHTNEQLHTEDLITPVKGVLYYDTYNLQTTIHTKHHIQIANYTQLPFIIPDNLEIDVQLNSPSDIELYISNTFIPWKIDESSGMIIVLVSSYSNNLQRIIENHMSQDYICAITTDSTINHMIYRFHYTYCVHDIYTTYLDKAPMQCAKVNLTIKQKIWVIHILISTFSSIIVSIVINSALLLDILYQLYFIFNAFVMSLRIVILYSGYVYHCKYLERIEGVHNLLNTNLLYNKLIEKHLRRYTIMIPLLYEEDQVVSGLIEHLLKMDYPSYLLDIIFVCEEKDPHTIELVKQHGGNNIGRTIVSPTHKYNTKPRACNYALQFAAGEFLVIYDAEDRPDVKQLKKASYLFHNRNDIDCVQSILIPRNYEDNMLIRMITIEYFYWFCLQLFGMSELNHFIPLGGSSNHFRVSTLKRMNGWDAYNVTEDADLGVRFARNKCKTMILHSVTYEEAPKDFTTWKNQRVRWNKGFIQTYFVHMRNPVKLFRDFGYKNFFMFNMVIFIHILCNCIFPVHYVLVIIGIVDTFILHKGIFVLQIYYLLFNLFYISWLYIICTCINLKGKFITQYSFFTWLMLYIYWGIQSIPAILAFKEFIVSPHYWRKTPHTQK